MASLRSFLFGKPVPEAQWKYHYSQEEEKDSTKPVIAMIGWAGADPKHVEKYTKIYNNEGYHVVSICPSPFHFNVPDSSVGAKIEPILEEFQRNPIIVHSFSMNGIGALISLWKKAGAEKCEKGITGIIFDSAPSVTLPHQNGKAMMLSRPSHPLMSDKGREMLFRVYNEIRNFFLFPLLTLPATRPFFTPFWYIRDKIRLPKQQLFLYSTADAMIPVKDLEEFIEAQKSRGNDVKSVDFGKSDHVAHFRGNPEKYKNECVDFVHKIRSKL